MYEAFYGLKEKPFHVTADPAFLYPSHQHREAMAHLVYGIKQRLGFLLITGEVGTGKTTLAKALIDQLDPPIRTALILNPTLSGAQLLKAVLRDFGAFPFGPGLTENPVRTGATRGELLQAIEQFLVQQADIGGVGVLVIDEAQALSTGALEQVRLLSTVETTKSKLLQIVLVGQPEISQRLADDYRLRALNQRIAVRYNIQPLVKEEVAAYIQHRLKIAGARESLCFTDEAVLRITQLSGGVPRRINLLCDHALLAGFVRESFTIDGSMVEQAQQAVTGAPEKPEEIELSI